MRQRIAACGGLGPRTMPRGPDWPLLLTEDATCDALGLDGGVVKSVQIRSGPMRF